MKKKLSMWKTVPSYYLFQTEDSEIAKKLRRNKRFVQVAYSPNSNFWIFERKYDFMRQALEKFKAVSGSVAVYNKKLDLYE